MTVRWFRRAGAEPLPPGPRGRILFLGPFNGGIGGIERLTRVFADWVETSGYTATMLFEHEFPPGPFTVRATERLRVLPTRSWGRAIEDGPYDFLYVIPAGLRARRWAPRVRRVRAPKVLLDLDPHRKWAGAFDVLHCEAPRAAPPPWPHVVATPDPRPTIAPGPPVPPGDFHLTVFTPYGRIKGHHRIPAFLRGTRAPLVWCYAPQTFAERDPALGREIRARVEEVADPLLTAIDTPPLEEIYRLYRGARGYVCFSEEESMGWALLDAMALGKPLCSRRVGVCRALEGFRPTEDFASPVFATYPLPPVEGYEALFREVPRALAQATRT